MLNGLQNQSWDWLTLGNLTESLPREMGWHLSSLYYFLQCKRSTHLETQVEIVPATFRGPVAWQVYFQGCWWTHFVQFHCKKMLRQALFCLIYVLVLLLLVWVQLSFKKKFTCCLFQRQSNRKSKREREMTLRKGYLPSVVSLQGQGWKRVKPGAWNSVPREMISHIGGWVANIWHHILPYSRKEDQKQS